jgi:hypothetical protein
MAIALPPLRSISLATASAASAPLVYVIATFAPSDANRLAMAAPIPREPPVISATFPSSFFDIVVSLPSNSLSIKIQSLMCGERFDSPWRSDVAETSCELPRT